MQEKLIRDRAVLFCLREKVPLVEGGRHEAPSRFAGGKPFDVRVVLCVLQHALDQMRGHDVGIVAEDVVDFFRFLGQRDALLAAEGLDREIRDHDARREPPGPDLAAALVQLFGKGLREVRDGALGGAVKVEPQHHRVVAAVALDVVDESALALLLHLQRGGAAAEDCAAQVDIQHRVDLLLAQLPDCFHGLVDAGVVDPDVDLAESLRGKGREGAQILARGYAAGKALDRAGRAHAEKLLFRFFEALRIHAVDDKIPSVLPEELCHLKAEAAGRAGDDDSFHVFPPKMVSIYWKYSMFSVRIQDNGALSDRQSAVEESLFQLFSGFMVGKN